MAKEPELESIFELNSIQGKCVSKDGKFLAYITGKSFKEFKKEADSSLRLKYLETGKEEELNDSHEVITQPSFSVDSEYLSFISSKENNSHLILLNLKNQTKMAVKCPGSVIQYRWGKESIAMLISPENTEFKNTEDPDDGYFFEERENMNILYIFNLKSGFRQVKNIPQIWEFDYVGETIVAVSSDSPREGSWYRNYLIEYDESGNYRKLYTPKDAQIALPVMSKNSGLVTFVESMWSDRGVTSGDLMLLDRKNSSVENLSKGDHSSYSSSIFLKDDTIIALCQEEENFSIKEFRNGKVKEIWRKRGSAGPGMAPEIIQSGDHVYLDFSSSQSPQEILSINLKTAVESTMTEINRNMIDYGNHEWMKVKWNSRDGLEISGFLRNPGKKKPLLVVIHGGPTGSIKETFMDRYSFLITKGYSIFMPNFRGSTGKGRDFSGMNYRDMGGKDLDDILTGVENLIEKGMVDRERIAITGGSYGGFMTKWAITQSNLFRCAIALFGISDWVSFHGTTNIPEWDEMQYGQSPYVFGKFVSFSPIRYVGNITAKLLIMHGEVDPSVPPGQSFQFYRALKEQGKDVRLLIFPREGHGFMERAHIRKSMEETLKMLEENLK